MRVLGSKLSTKDFQSPNKRNNKNELNIRRSNTVNEDLKFNFNSPVKFKRQNTEKRRTAESYNSEAFNYLETNISTSEKALTDQSKLPKRDRNNIYSTSISRSNTGNNGTKSQPATNIIKKVKFKSGGELIEVINIQKFKLPEETPLKKNQSGYCRCLIF
jgi:hypothetical protein